MPHIASPGLLGAIALTTSLLLAACGTTASRVVSPGPMYAGAAAVERVSVYVFIDIRPEYIHPVFRKTFEENLSTTLSASGIPSRQVWSLDTAVGQRLQDNWKNSTMGSVTSVSVSKTLQENRVADAAFRPTHYVLAFPRDAYKSADGAILDIKWDVIDAGNGNVEWSVYTRTPVLSRQMSDGEALAAARGLIDTITKELQARNVIRQ